MNVLVHVCHALSQIQKKRRKVIFIVFRGFIQKMDTSKLSYFGGFVGLIFFPLHFFFSQTTEDKL